MADFGDVLVGLAQLIAEANGTEESSTSRRRSPRWWST
jgi:hypothetical protein